MAKSKDYEIAIKIAGEIEKSFYNSTKLTKKELSSIAKTASATSGIIQKSFGSGINDAKPFFTGLESAGQAAFHAIAASAAVAATAVAAVVAGSVMVGSSFESSFAGVKKTVNGSAAELQALEDSIRDMAKNMPMTANELSEIAEAAGQLGIETGNISEFTKTMADLGVATNLTSGDAATQFARFANITGMPQEKFDELGSTVVALGNNLATTESEIVEMGMRLAGAGAQVHMSESQIMGFSAALSSVGIEAEAGGSAFSKVMVDMQLAVETGKGSLNDYAKVAGMTAGEFQQAFKADAAGSINSFVSGLSDVERNGMSAIAVLDSMGIKEIRLRDALLRASNAGDLFSNAINISNKAWEENVALTNEAEQRYATFESKLEIFKNVVKDIGITLYQDMREPLAAGLDEATKFAGVLAGKIEGSNMITDITAKIPTAVRKIKEFSSSLYEFSQPFLAIGGWLVDNPGVIVGAIVGIGVAIETYKVVSGVMSMVSALGALGPVGLVIMGIAGAAAVISGIGVSVKKAAADAKKANLAAHFGDISLSMEDLDEVAGYIVSSDNLGKVREAISAFNELDGIQDTISDSVSAINKMNWKVSIGMGLEADEQEQYKTEMANYVAQAQEYVTQKQYAVNIAVGVLTDGDLEGSNIVNQVNAFYEGKQAELAGIGTQLNETITTAFQDGLLDMDEVAEITKLQQQMARIQAQVADSNFDAKLDLMGMKLEGGNLDAESFQNLQAEIQEQVAAATADYDESYTLSVANAKLMLKDGAINPDEYNAQVAEFKENYLEQVGDIQLKASNFQTDTIMQQYDDEIGNMVPKIRDNLEIALGGTINDINLSGNAVGGWSYEQIANWLNIQELDSTTKAALSDLWEKMKPQLDEMETIKAQYVAAGQEIPDSLSKGISDAAIIGILAGDENAMFAAIGETATNSEEYKNALKTMQDNGTYIPEIIATAISENQKAINTEVGASWESTRSAIQTTFGAGVDVTVPIKVKMNSYNNGGNLQAPYSNSYIEENKPSLQGIFAGLDGHKDGGIFDQPHIAWFAEAGKREAAIPIDGSQNAIDLWTKTGELLGVNGFKEDSFTSLSSEISSGIGSTKANNETTEGSGGGIVYSPTLQFYGDSPSKDDIEGAMHDSQDEFNTMMQKWVKENGRLGFA